MEKSLQAKKFVYRKFENENIHGNILWSAKNYNIYNIHNIYFILIKIIITFSTTNYLEKLYST